MVARCARFSRSAGRALAACAALALAALPARAEERAAPPIEPPRACEVCTPGAPPPPAVQEQVRRLNESANWRKHGSRSETVELGTETHMRIHRAWSSGRFESGVVNPSAGAAPAPRATFQRPSAPRRATLADRSRDRSRGSLGDRRGGDRSGRRSRDRDRMQDEGTRSGSSSSRSSLGRSGLGSRSRGSTFGTDDRATGRTSFGQSRSFGSSDADE